MSNKKHPGGRPPAKVLIDNFTGPEKVNNKSRRKIWECNDCTPTSGNGQCIEGQDNQSSDICEDSSIKDSRGHLILDCPSLTVRTFETLGKLRNNYSYHIYQRALTAGKPVRRKHAHMHTRNHDSIDTNLATDLDANFA
jgi:hypothetical protein